MTDAGASALGTSLLGVRPLLGLGFRPPVSDQLVGQAHPGRKMGKHAPRPLSGSTALLSGCFRGFGGLSHALQDSAGFRRLTRGPTGICAG